MTSMPQFRGNALSPSSSSMRSSWLYLAIRSERAGEPVLICPPFVATARSAIVESSVSPERWLHDRGVAGALGHLDGVEGLGQRADLVDLDQDAVGDARSRCPARSRFGVGDEQVVADELDLVAELVGQQLPAVPVVLGAAVLDRDDRVLRDQLGEIARPCRPESSALALRPRSSYLPSLKNSVRRSRARARRRSPGL